MKRLFLSLILILLVSGCANLPFDIPFFQTGGPKIKELPNDIISITNATVLPSTSVREGDQFSVIFDLTNQDEFLSVPVSFNLYDTGLCKILEGGYPRISPSETNIGELETLSPTETRLVEWTFQAPSAEEIAHLRVTCPIRFRFDFSHTATSEIDVVVIDEVRLRELQRGEGVTTFTPTVNVGRGPIKIYFDFGVSLPVKEGSTITVYVLVEDKGTGLLREIGTGKFKITFPEYFNITSASCPSKYFTCSGRTCTNDVDSIPIISKKSLEIRCSGIKTPDVDFEKTYFISAELEYDYSAVGEVNVEVNP